MFCTKMFIFFLSLYYVKAIFFYFILDLKYICYRNIRSKKINVRNCTCFNKKIKTLSLGKNVDTTDQNLHITYPHNLIFLQIKYIVFAGQQMFELFFTAIYGCEYLFFWCVITWYLFVIEKAMPVQKLIGE